MDKYTKEDIIFYTKDLNIDKIIGKECYFSNSADILLKKANEGENFQKLIVVDGDSITPFIAEDNFRWTFIIVKRVEYAPFVNAKEFIERYIDVNNYAKYYRIKHISENRYMDIDGISMWLTIDGTEYFNVTRISDKGIALGINMLSDWDYVFKHCKFLDGSCCGKKVND